MFNFLGKALVWLARQTQGKTRGDATVAAAESNPVIAGAIQQGEAAAKQFVLNTVAAHTGIDPTPQGVAALVGGLIQTHVQAPVSVKESLVAYTDSHLLGSNFVVSEEAQEGSAPEPEGPASEQETPEPGMPQNNAGEAGETVSGAGATSDPSVANAVSGGAALTPAEQQDAARFQQSETSPPTQLPPGQLTIGPDGVLQGGSPNDAPA